jgi:hypothetical protein
VIETAPPGLPETKRPMHYCIAWVLPICFVVVELYLRAGGGPFWQWNLLDPAYFYLLDSLNLLVGNPPGHIYHPGVTVQAFGAVMIGLAGLIRDSGAVDAVLDDPEGHLKLFSNGLIGLNAIGLALVGIFGRKVFGMWLPALVCQLAPFMSTIILKHGYLPKPESMLVFATCLLITLAIMTLPDDLSRRYRDRLMLGFAGVAGFIVATKLTAAPLVLLPLFLLRGPRAAMIYICASVIAFGVFFSPAIGASQEFIEWIVRVALGSGAHGSGAQTVIVWDEYTSAFMKILKRPSLKVPLILALLALSISVWRRRSGLRLPAQEIWLLFGISMTQLTHTALVAKQPTAFYMIPSYMLGAVSVLLSVRLLWAVRPSHWRLSVEGGIIGSVLFAIFVSAQTAGILRLSEQLEALRVQAASVNDAKFTQCARVYIYSASSPVYALYLANKMSGSRFSTALKQRHPSEDYWIDDWWAWEPVELQNWDGVQDFAALLNRYPCVYMRGNRLGSLGAFLKTHAPGVTFDTSCRAGIENIATLSVDCQGNLR